FLPNGDFLVSASLDRSVRLWKLPQRTGEEPVEIARLCCGDLIHEHLVVLSDGRIVVFRAGGIEIWRNLQEKVAELPTSVNFHGELRVSSDERSLFIVRYAQTVEQWSLDTAKLLARYAADIVRPETVPRWGHTREGAPTARGNCWRTVGGNFIHTGDGPRGWA